MSVLVTGAGGPAGVAVIRALGQAGERTVAVDADRDAVGLRLADEAMVVPRADGPGYAAAILGAARCSGADALICTVAEEMDAVDRITERLADEGVATWLPSAEAVGACVDKWRFATVVADAGVTLPATGLGEAPDGPGPWIVKPRFGRGSRHVMVAEEPEELAWAIRRVPEPIVQTQVEGREFTVDVLTDRDGRVRAAVPRYRLETRGGISTRGVTFRHAGVEEGVQLLLERLGLRGVANVQGFVTDDDRVVFIEVNPRFSGGLPLSLAAGSDLVGQYLRIVRGLGVQSEKLDFRADVKMSRHFVEVFE